MSSPSADTERPDISLAVPFYNEEDSIDVFFERVESVMRQLPSSYEIVCVNDGSRDGTLGLLLRHRERNPRIVVVDLSRNFGKDIALTAAIEHCRGKAVVPMDADLQDPPELLPRLIEKWREGFEMVVARRVSRQSDTAIKRVSPTGSTGCSTGWPPSPLPTRETSV
jgi:glycosyltransferase involved in cell wall biosynthesis